MIKKTSHGFWRALATGLLFLGEFTCFYAAALLNGAGGLV